jgi:hypothetical protein
MAVSRKKREFILHTLERSRPDFLQGNFN